MITALIRKTSASVIHFLLAEKTRFFNQEKMQSQFSHSLLFCSVENYSIQLTLCSFLFLVFQQMNRHRYTLSKTYRRCLSPVLPSQLHTTLPLLAEGSLLLRLIITCLTFGLFLWIPVRARSARWIFPGKNWVILSRSEHYNLVPWFFSYCAGSSRKEPWERVCEHQAISSAFALFLGNMKKRESFIEKSFCLCLINVPST